MWTALVANLFCCSENAVLVHAWLTLCKDNVASLPNVQWDKIAKGFCRLLWPWRIIAGRYGGNDDGQYRLLPHPPDSAACNNLNVWTNKVVYYSQSTVLRLKRCEAMSFDLLDITWTTWCCRWALGIRNIEASKMHHDESWWQRSPKNLEPVLHQAGGANLWGWGGPGANIQVALQQLACYSPFFEDTTNKNVKLSNDFNLFSLNVLFAKWMIKFAVKNSKTDEKQVDSASWFPGDTGW